jgi:CRP/FNR family transcriptional regulator, cyclic AMP receptor protein
MVDSVNALGFIAASLVALTFYMQSMIALRSTAILSNIFFITYAILNSPVLYPVLYLHLFLMPLNSYRLMGLVLQMKLKIHI